MSVPSKNWGCYNTPSTPGSYSCGQSPIYNIPGHIVARQIQCELHLIVPHAFASWPAVYYMHTCVHVPVLGESVSLQSGKGQTS